MAKRSFIVLVVFLLIHPLFAWTEEAPQQNADPVELKADETTSPETAESTPAESAETTEVSNDPFSLRWKNFLDATRSLVYWELLDGRLTIRGGADMQIDGTVGSGSDLFEQTIGEIDSKFGLRRFRVFAQGDFDEHLRYSVSFDLGKDAGLKDFFVEGIDMGLFVWGYEIGKFRVGSFGEPFSMERRTGRNSLAFLERSLPVWTFAPGRNVGYMLYDTAWEGRVSWQAGFFSLGNTDEDNASASVLSITGRMTWLPIYKDEGRTLLHVGASYSSRDPRSNEVRYRSRPEARYVPFVVDTGPIESNKSHLYGLEVAYKDGPLWAHGEYIQANVDSAREFDPMFWGAFLQAGFFLTGESRPYNKTEGIWGNVDPISGIDSGIPLREKLQLKRGDRGATEISVRISTLNLNDGLVRGGILTNYSVGVSWYPSQNARWMFEYIYSNTKNEGNANILLLRYQYSLY